MKKHAAALGATILGLTLVAGCGGSGPGDDRAESSGPSASQASVAPDSQGGSVDIDQWANDVVVAMSGTTMHVVATSDTDVPGGSFAMEFDLDMTDTDNAKMAGSMDIDGMGRVDMIFVDGRAYGKQAGSWEELQGFDSSQLSSQLDLGAQIDKQRDTITKIVLVGPETVEGVQTTHYVVDYDSTEMFDSTGITTSGVAYDYWLDDEMRIVKASASVDMRAGDESASMTIECLVTGYGVPVTIEAPPMH